MYALGVTFNGFFFYIFNSWQMVLLAYKMIPFVFILMGLIFHIEESPFDLVTNYDPQYSFSIFERIALLNGKSEYHGITVE